MAKRSKLNKEELKLFKNLVKYYGTCFQDNGVLNYLFQTDEKDYDSKVRVFKGYASLMAKYLNLKREVEFVEEFTPTTDGHQLHSVVTDIPYDTFSEFVYEPIMGEKNPVLYCG